MAREHDMCEFLESPKILARVQNSTTNAATEVTTIVAQVPRKRIKSKHDFQALLQAGKPVIIEALDVGKCSQKWTPTYLVEMIGKDRQVSDEIA